MCPTAVRAEQDFAKLVSQLGSSLYFERFLVEGFSGLPDCYQIACPGLGCWKGVERLKRDFAQFVNAPDHSVSLFGNSKSLIDSTVNCLLGKANRILTTDLEWPPYLEALRVAAHELKKSVVVCRLRKPWLHRGESKLELTTRLRDAYLASQCDGLFLSSISYLGLATPIRELLQTIPDCRLPRFVTIDAAQTLGQKPVDLRDIGADITIGGTQKWMQAGRPLRVAITRPDSDFRLTGYDPLHQFTQTLFSDHQEETTDPGSLITAAASLEELSGQTLEYRWQTRSENRRSLHELVNAMDDVIDSAILTIPLEGAASLTRNAMHKIGLVASRFNNAVRLSMPSDRLDSTDLHRIWNAIR